VKMKWIAIASLVLVGACANEPQRTEPTTNKNVPVVRLFEHDGVRVYRFNDGGRDHYYAVPMNGARAEMHATISCGKNCTADDATPTLAAAR